MHSLSSLYIVTFLTRAVLGAGVSGSATGFAHGVTGGGSATPVTPTTNDELVSYLTDSVARVILINKTFNFIGSEGTTTATGCIPSSNTCGSSGQNAIDSANYCSSSYPAVSVTYDDAGVDPILVASDKSIVGVGSAGVIQGRGLRLYGVSNVIIQNVHITDLNPSLIWGGDAITLQNTDLVWIDHCKFSLVGRQMIVTGFDPAGRVTISNNEFDGVTSWSASCNGEHYWTMLFLGSSDYITLANNYVHNCSGRAPKVGGDGYVIMHAVNNYFYDNLGHDFDVAEGGNVLMEGNYFYLVTTPITAASATAGGTIFNVPSSSDTSTCTAYLGRACLQNALLDSGSFPSFTSTYMMGAIEESYAGNGPAAISSYDVPNSVIANAGIGKL